MLIARTKLFLFLALLPLITSCNPFSYGSDNGASAFFAGISATGAVLSSDGSKIVLTWSAATNPTGTVHYFIYGDADFTELLDQTDDTFWTFNDPVPGTTYVFGVRARDDNGFDTNTSLAVVRVSLNAPDFDGLTSAHATANSKIQLTWSASPSTDVAGYNIYLSRDLVNPIDTTTATQYFVTGLTPSTTYTFVVRAKNSYGTTDKNVVTKSATTLSYTVPDFSGVVSATTLTGVAGMTSVQLSWTRAGGTVTGYQIFYSTTSGGQDFDSPITPGAPLSKIVSSNATTGPYLDGVTTTAATVDGLNPDTTYYFVVRAFYWDGSYTYQEANTIERSAKTAATPPPPIPPVVTSISPGAGPIAGSTQVFLVGNLYVVGATVKIGGVDCTPVAVTGATSLNCYTTANAAGTYDVVVTNPDTGVGTLAAGFTYTATPAPAVTLVTPASGASTGGTAVTISGSGFSTGTAPTVSFGGSNCTSVVVSGGGSTINCTTSSHVTAAVSVTVTNPDTQYGSLPAGFSYVGAPTINSQTDTPPGISPAVGALAGGMMVTISGTNFRNDVTAPTVTLGGVDCTPLFVDSPTQMRCFTPGVGSAGKVGLVITNHPDEQTVSVANIFTYQGAPTVTSVAPTAGAIAGGTALTVNGSLFDQVGVVTVSVGALPCTSVSVTSSNRLTCTLPLHSAGAKDVIVTNADGQFGLLGAAYTYQRAPSVTSVSPAFGLSGGGTTLTINGADFSSGALVDLGGANCVVTSRTSSQIICTTSMHASATVNVKVTNNDSQTGQLTNGYIYTSLPAPTLTSVTPSIGTTSGGVTITVNGTNFSSPTVTLGTGSSWVNCDSVDVISPTELTCVPAARSSGLVHVKVTNSDTQVATLNNSFRYLALTHGHWNKIQAVGEIEPVPQTGLTGDVASVTLGWNAFTCTGCTVQSYNLYRGTSPGVYDTTIQTGISTASTTWQDFTIDPLTTYYYTVRAVVSGIELLTAENDTEVKVVTPDKNLVLMHRWMVNAEVCTTILTGIDYENDYRCAYAGPGGDGTYYDIGQSFLVQKYEVGCNYTPAPGCGDLVNGCVGLSAPGSGVGSPNDVYYNRAVGDCYLKVDSSTWKNQSDATLSTGQRSVMASIMPGLPPLINIDQARAQATCEGFGYSGFGEMRLPKRREQLAAAAWSPSLTDAEIVSIEGGSNLPVNGYCNTSAANGVTFDNLTTPADIETLPGKLTSAPSMNILITGSTYTSSCVSRYGLQDAVGNVWEWTSDQLGSCTLVSGYYNCDGTTSNIDPANNDWATAKFDGTVQPGGKLITGFSSLTGEGKYFNVPLGLPMPAAASGATRSAWGALEIKAATSGAIDPSVFHGNKIGFYTGNAVGSPVARAVLGGGGYDTGQGPEGTTGRYTFAIGGMTTFAYQNSGLRCYLPAD